MVHIRYDGRSVDVSEEQLRVHSRMSDEQIKEHVAGHFNLGPGKLESYVVDRTPHGDMIVRPEAVYG